MAIHESVPDRGQCGDVEFRANLETWLNRVCADSSESAALLWHLGDLRDACWQTFALLEALTSTDLDTGEGRLRLATLHGELFEHIPTHLDGSKAAMTALLRRVYSAAEARGEL